jgi:hypothetical protein
MSGAVEAAGAASHDDLIVLVENTGTAIILTDVPALGWITGAPGAPAVPVTTEKLTPQWARVEVDTKHVTPGLIGGAYISVTMVEESFRRSFPGFLDHLASSTGLPIVGTGLLAGPLTHGYWAWVADRYAGEDGDG